VAGGLENLAALNRKSGRQNEAEAIEKRVEDIRSTKQ
jgi:hypothetical protein